MRDLDTTQWVLALLALVLVGYAKTGIAGLGTVAVAIFAQVLPARESTGTLLPLLICGDVIAVFAYRRHADWGRLWRLFPWVAVGTVAGALLVGRVDDAQMRRAIGAILLAIVLLAGWLRRGGQEVTLAVLRRERGVVAAVGALAGLTTMVANAAGPIMTLYLLAAGLPMLGFLGTTAWFFLVINLFKLPFSVGLGLVTASSLAFCLVGAPAVVVGALVGRATIRYVDQRLFENLALAATLVAAVRLLL